MPSISDKSAPSTPVSFRAALVTTNQATLIWNASMDNARIAGYRLYRNGSLIASPISTTYTDLGLPSSTLLRYGVEAVDSSNNVSARSFLSARTSDVPVGSGTGGSPIVVTPPGSGPTTVAVGSKPTLGGRVGVTTPSSSGHQTIVAVDGTQVSRDGDLDTTSLTNGEHQVTVTSPDTGEAASSSVKVANTLTPYQTVRNTLFAPLKGHKVIMNGGMIILIILVLAGLGWLLYYFLWKRNHSSGYNTVNTNL